MKEINLSVTNKKLSDNMEAVPERGSLGLLALGAVGLVAWRNKREEVKIEKSKDQK